jgi:predicted nucleic acid-binding Zn ribbon protein
LHPRERRAKRSAEPQGIGSVLEELAVGRSLAAGLALGRLARRWRDVVGERLAEESAPLRLDGGLLLVRVSSAAWATQVTFLAGAVAKEANGILGSEIVRTVKVVVGEGSADKERGRG